MDIKLIYHNELQSDVESFIQLQPQFIYKKDKEGIILKGKYYYNLTYSNFYTSGEKCLKIVIPYDYPASEPMVFSEEPLPEGLSHVNCDGSFCMGTIGEISQFLVNNPSIADYLERFLNPFIYTIDWYAKYESYPFGEREHGAKGLKEYYINDWGLTEEQFRIMVYIIFNKKYRGHAKCFCGSGKKLRDCHGAKLLPIIKNELVRQRFLLEIKMIINER